MSVALGLRWSQILPWFHSANVDWVWQWLAKLPNRINHPNPTQRLMHLCYLFFVSCMHLVANCLSTSGCSVGSRDTAKFLPFAGVSFKSCCDDLETENGIDHHNIEIYWNITLMIMIIIIINAMFSLWLWWSLSLSILNMALLLVAEFQPPHPSNRDPMSVSKGWCWCSHSKLQTSPEKPWGAQSRAGENGKVQAQWQTYVYI